ncbi:MAG: hypothetical protein MI861_09675 [Pirellulales bacterium]|nr:hypothetical protein [Pirellulales bacterium]
MNTKTNTASRWQTRGIRADHFFEELEEQIVQKLREEAMTDEGRAKLIEETGVDDPVLVDELIQLGITADGLIALRLYPLVQVAWAGEAVDDAERREVMGCAIRLGIQEESVPWLLLNTWLKKRPSAMGMDAWKRYTRDIFAQMSEVAIRRLIQLTHQQMMDVAKASGGYLGIGKVSKQEREMIARLTSIMNRETLRLGARPKRSPK